MFNFNTMSLSFQISCPNGGFDVVETQSIMPNSYFPWIKSFKLISQPNSTILFECDSVDQYSMLHSIINLNNKKRLIQEGLIVPSK